MLRPPRPRQPPPAAPPAPAPPAPDQASPISTVNSPNATLLGGPTASTMVSPCRHAGSPLMSTVCEPSTITPGPCGGTGNGVAQTWISAPPAPPVIMLPIEAAAVALAVCSAASAAGAPGVPAAAAVAASAAWIVASDADFAD